MEINGKKVVDANKSLRISINSTDAKLGKTKDPGGCAAARAILRSFKPDGAKSARVHIGRVYIEYPDKWIRYKTPNSLKNEIVSFDRGSKSEFMVGDYTLERISDSNRFGARNKKAGNDPRTKSKRPKIARAIH